MGWKPKKKAAQQVEEEEEEEEPEGEEDEEDEENQFANLPKSVIRRITAIRNMHTEYEEIDAAYKIERIALEQKYLAHKQVLMTKRKNIVSGEVDVPKGSLLALVVSQHDCF